MRRLQSLLALSVAIVCIVSMAPVLLSSDQATAPRQITLMQTLADWKYPGSNMPDGASMGDGGNPQIQSVKCQAILTTPDPIEKVIDYYTTKLTPAADAVLPGNKVDAPTGDAKSVAIQDDSQGRPVAVRVIVVNKLDTSTTLVISRGRDEKETHIAWVHYIRLGEKK
jgi:hypothetical protein